MRVPSAPFDRYSIPVAKGVGSERYGIRFMMGQVPVDTTRAGINMVVRYPFSYPVPLGGGVFVCGFDARYAPDMPVTIFRCSLRSREYTLAADDARCYLRTTPSDAVDAWIGDEASKSVVRELAPRWLEISLTINGVELPSVTIKGYSIDFIGRGKLFAVIDTNVRIRDLAIAWIEQERGAGETGWCAVLEDESTVAIDRVRYLM